MMAVTLNFTEKTKLLTIHSLSVLRYLLWWTGFSLVLCEKCELLCKCQRLLSFEILCERTFNLVYVLSFAFRIFDILCLTTDQCCWIIKNHFSLNKETGDYKNIIPGLLSSEKYLFDTYCLCSIWVDRKGSIGECVLSQLFQRIQGGL